MSAGLQHGGGGATAPWHHAPRRAALLRPPWFQPAWWLRNRASTATKPTAPPRPPCRKPAARDSAAAACRTTTINFSDAWVAPCCAGRLNQPQQRCRAGALRPALPRQRAGPWRTVAHGEGLSSPRWRSATPHGHAGHRVFTTRLRRYTQAAAAGQVRRRGFGGGISWLLNTCPASMVVADFWSCISGPCSGPPRGNAPTQARVRIGGHSVERTVNGLQPGLQPLLRRCRTLPSRRHRWFAGVRLDGKRPAAHGFADEDLHAVLRALMAPARLLSMVHSTPLVMGSLGSPARLSQSKPHCFKFHSWQSAYPASAGGHSTPTGGQEPAQRTGARSPST